MKKQKLINGKLTAIAYLIEHSVYRDEWSGAGMYEAIRDVCMSDGTLFLKAYLDALLKEAEDF